MYKLHVMALGRNVKFQIGIALTAQPPAQAWLRNQNFILPKMSIFQNLFSFCKGKERWLSSLRSQKSHDQPALSLLGWLGGTRRTVVLLGSLAWHPAGSCHTPAKSLLRKAIASTNWSSGVGEHSVTCLMLILDECLAVKWYLFG